MRRAVAMTITLFPGTILELRIHGGTWNWLALLLRQIPLTLFRFPGHII
jgi:hypothetical protein